MLCLKMYRSVQSGVDNDCDLIIFSPFFLAMRRSESRVDDVTTQGAELLRLNRTRDEEVCFSFCSNKTEK